MNMNLFFGMVLLFASTAAQAVTCSGRCIIYYTDIIATLPANSTYNQIQDFKSSCKYNGGDVKGGSRNYRGRVPRNYRTGDYICEKAGSTLTHASGQGSDAFQALTATREDCSQQIASSGHSSAYGSIYENNMSCN